MVYRQPPLHVPAMRSAPAPGGPPLVQTIPAMQGPWSGNPQWGQNISFASDSNNRQKILNMPESGCPQVWTIGLGMYYDETGTAPAIMNFGVQAEITFGTGGATQTVDVDWQRGLQLTVIANSINIVAKYVTNTANVPADLRLIATIGNGPRGGPTNATLTQAFFALPGQLAQTANFPIPAFARSFTILPFKTLLGPFTDPYVVTSSVLLQGNQTPSNGAFINFDRIPSFSSGVPIPTGALYWNVNNAGAGNVAGFMVWNIDL